MMTDDDDVIEISLTADVVDETIQAEILDDSIYADVQTVDLKPQVPIPPRQHLVLDDLAEVEGQELLFEVIDLTPDAEVQELDITGEPC